MAMTLTYDDTGPIKKIIATWTSSAAGAAAATTKPISGFLIKGVTDPGATAPTTLYDIVITDGEGVNVLSACQSNLANRSATATEEVYFLLKNADATPIGVAAHPVVADPLTITVSNAGDSKNGEIILYYHPER